MIECPKRSEITVKGIGIDILSKKRGGEFLSSHGSQIMSRLLAPAERASSKKKLSLVEFCKRFTAKEAFFKALGQSWMGVAGFKHIKVTLLPHLRFHAQTVGNYFGAKQSGNGCFMVGPEWVAAQIFLLN